METLADPPYTVLRVRSGGKISDLTYVTTKIFRENSYRIDPTDPICVYYIAGLPDTTTMYKDYYKLNGRNCCFQEDIFPETPDRAFHSILETIEEASIKIKAHHAIPVLLHKRPK